MFRESPEYSRFSMFSKFVATLSKQKCLLTICIRCMNAQRLFLVHGSISFDLTWKIYIWYRIVLPRTAERAMSMLKQIHLPVNYFQFRGTTFHLVLMPFVSLHQRYGTPYLLTFYNLKLLILLHVI